MLRRGFPQRLDFCFWGLGQALLAQRRHRDATREILSKTALNCIAKHRGATDGISSKTVLLRLTLNTLHFSLPKGKNTSG